MSNDATLSIPTLDRLREQCRDLRLGSSTTVTVVCAPFPNMIALGALLCRSILASGRVFHLTFGEPVMDFQSLQNLIDTHSRSPIVFIGVDCDSWVDIRPSNSQLVFVGRGPKHLENATFLGDQCMVPAAVYSVARENFSVSNTELLLAIQGALLSDDAYSCESSYLDLLKIGLDSDVVRTTRSFLLFGKNFLPIPEMFSLSVRPYLPSLSGDPSGCKQLLDSAQLAITRTSSPVAYLTPEDRQHLVQALIPCVSTEALGLILGQDYEFPHEQERSPMRYLSQIRVLVSTAWALHVYGLGAGIMLGDRARLLRELVDLHLQCAMHLSQVVHQIITKNLIPSPEDGKKCTVFQLSQDFEGVALPIAQVLVELGATDNILVLKSAQGLEVSWRKSLLDIHEVMRSLHQLGARPRSVSESTLRITDCENMIEPVIDTMERLSLGANKSSREA